MSATHEMKDSGVEWIGVIPKEWEVVRLRFLCNVQTGNMDTQDNNPDGLYPFFVRSPNVERCDQFSFNNEAVLMAGDGVGAGKVFHHYRGRYGCHQRVYSLHSFSNVFGRYFFYFLSNNFYKKIEENNAKSTVDSIRLPMLKNFQVALPSYAEQQRIADYLDRKCGKIDESIEKQKHVIEKLKAYKQAVITEAVTKGLNPNAEMKDSGVEWIGMIPAHYTIKKIKYIGSARNGLTYSPGDITDETGTLVLRSSNIQNGRLCYDDNVYVSRPIPGLLKVRKGDILICSRNGSKQLIGKNAIITQEMDASFGAFMMIFRCKSPKFVKFVLDSNVFSYYLGTFLTSTINQLTNGNFLNMEIVYCEDEREREEIVTYLDRKCAAIDNSITSAEAMIEKLTAYKKSLIYELVTGKREV